MNKTRYFVQYKDQRKMWNTTSEITKINKRINANNETKPLKFKYMIKEHF